MKSFFIGLLVVSMATLFGCGGGGSTQETVATVSGTASQGKALAAGTIVTLTDALGHQKTTTVGKDGFYEFVTNPYTPPFLITSGGLVSFAATSGTTNINPLTTLSMQLALGTANVTGLSPYQTKEFSVQLKTVVAKLLESLHGIYPASVSDTQKDFLNGTLSIGLGVDAFFDYTVYHADPTGTLYTVGGKDKTDGAVYLVGGFAADKSVTITPNIDAINALGKKIFPTGTAGFTATMLSGKTILMNPANPAHVYTYNADGTWTAKYTDGSTTATSAGTWSIDASGHLIWTKTYDPLDNGASSTVNKPQTMTLVSSTSTTLTVSMNGTTGVWTYVGTPTTPTTTGFTTAMLSGKTFTYVDSNSNTGTIAFNTNGTSTGIAGTWSINASGQLVIYVTSSKNTATFTLTSSTSTKITASESISNGSQATITFTAA